MFIKTGRPEPEEKRSSIDQVQLNVWGNQIKIKNFNKPAQIPVFLPWHLHRLQDTLSA